MSTINIFDLVIVACGIYMIISGIKMKMDGKINTGLVMAKSMRPDQIRDKEGFIKFMWNKLLICGIICTISGIVNFVLSLSESQVAIMADIIFNALFFVMLIVYGFIVAKAQKKYMK